MKLVNIGFGNMVNSGRVICVVSPESAPIKRIIQQAKENGRLIDVTQGRKTASVIFTDSEHVLLSYLKADKLAQRFSEPEE
jgi:regulator of extracellular matrix RemA (YlzA/DUF370 family)